MYKDLEQHKKYMREWYIKNRENVKEKVRLYEIINREKVNTRKRNYHRLSKRKIWVKEYYELNKDKILKQQQKHSKENRVIWRKKIFNLLGGEMCKKCGFDDYRALQIDHVNGGGLKAYKNDHRLRKPMYYFRVIEKDINSYQVLCANCNWIKRSENNELPQSNNKSLN